jgi:hypothetical protein
MGAALLQLLLLRNEQRVTRRIDQRSRAGAQLPILHTHRPIGVGMSGRCGAAATAASIVRRDGQ